MKKNEAVIVAKKARKAFKQELTEKIATQLKAAVGAVGADLKKNNKIIEKAAKNLAKKLSKQVVSKKAPATIKTEVSTAPATEKAAVTAKTKVPAVKKTTAKSE